MNTRLPAAQEFHFHEVPKLSDRLKSREAYRKDRHSYRASNSGTVFPRSCPCPKCGGEGQHYNPEDNDPVEGYKMATKHTCAICRGTGEHPDPEMFWAQYNRLKAAELDAIARHKEIRNIQIRILKTLQTSYTKPQLKLAGFHNPKGIKK